MNRNILIIGSLMLNVFLIGMLVGGQIKKTPDPTDHMRPPQYEMRAADQLFPIRALAELPPDLRRQSRSLLRENLKGSRELQGQMAQQRREIALLLKADQIDRAAITEAMAEVQSLQVQQQNQIADAILSVLEALPDQERAALMAKVEERRAAAREKARERFKERRQQRDGNRDR